MKNLKYYICLSVFIFLSSVAIAQEAPTTTAPAAPVAMTVPDAPKDFNESLFLDPKEIMAIRDALNGIAPLDPTLTSGPKPPPVAKPTNSAAVMVAPIYRTIHVSGVLYKSDNDWIVWINGYRITPKKRIPEIREIKVDASSRVYLKWYDNILNKVISINLRPHQVYDIGTGILLPGLK